MIKIKYLTIFILILIIPYISFSQVMNGIVAENNSARDSQISDKLTIVFEKRVLMNNNGSRIDSLLNGIKIIPIRFKENPIITPGMLPGKDGENINGPSLIKVPDWVPNPLGRYYLYFAHHEGKYIRLAYADSLQGPWTVYKPGTLTLLQASSRGFTGHIASPDVHVRGDEKKIYMYYHGNTDGNGQKTGLAVSDDGINFTPITKSLGRSYFRVWQYNGTYYALGKRDLYRATDPAGIEPFEKSHEILTSGKGRHSAVMLRDDILFVFYSKKGDMPERIVLSFIDLTPHWKKWKATEPIDILNPEYKYEGVNEPIGGFTGDAVYEPVHQLRDPCIYEENGSVYMLYSVAGENGIGGAELLIKNY